MSSPIMIENQNVENVSIYMNDYFPGMALSWYWGLTNIPINGLYILQTNNDDKNLFNTSEYMYILHNIIDPSFIHQFHPFMSLN
jgi:hypothetical protein